MRSRLEWLGVIVVLGVALAFFGSFFAGLDGADPETEHVVQDPGVPALPEPPDAGSRVRVEVLNGTGRSGLARAITGRLRDAGFDVVYFGNASATADSSLVISRIADLSAARSVARKLEIARIEERVDSTLLLDVTVILGRDFDAQADRR